MPYAHIALTVQYHGLKPQSFIISIMLTALMELKCYNNKISHEAGRLIINNSVTRYSSYVFIWSAAYVCATISNVIILRRPLG